MDNALPPDDKEVERLLLIKAVEEARRDPRPSILNEIVGAKLEAKMKELKRKIATSLGTTEVLDDEEADRRLMAKPWSKLCRTSHRDGYMPKCI